MSRRYKRVLGNRKYKDYTDEKLAEAVKAVRTKSLSIRKASEKYGIHRNTIWNRMKGITSATIGRPQALSVEEEEAIVAHLIAMSCYGFPMTVFDLRMLVKSYLTRCGKNVPVFKNNLPGKDWGTGFLVRYKKVISERMAKNISHNRAATNEEMLRAFFENFRKEIEGVPPENIWNYDETNLVDDPGSKKVITRRGAKYPERIRNASKACTSIMASCNAAGEFAPLYINYKAERLWSTWMEGGPPGARYGRTPSGWFDFGSFEEWFVALMLPILKKQEGRKILVGDNLSSHLNVHVLQLCEEHNIGFIALPPNTTHLLQPLDVGVFKSMKVSWRFILDEWKTTAGGSRCVSVPKEKFPALLKGMLERMEPTLPSNIKSGFAKAGLCPFNPIKAIERLPKKVLGEKAEVFDVTKVISSTFIEHLEEKRVQVTKPMRQKRKMLNVEPGKSVGSADVMAETVVNEKKKNERKKPRKAATKQSMGKAPTEATKNPLAGPSRKRTRTPDDSSGSEFTVPYAESEDSFGGLMEEIVDAQPDGNIDIPNHGYVVGDFVVVGYEGKFYPGQITKIEADKFHINAMQKKGRQWIWPIKKDLMEYDLQEILMKIDAPSKDGRRDLFKIPEMERFDSE